MTICASVKVRDGIVLGTDSMAQILGQDQHGNRALIKTYSNARKLFHIRKLHIGVMTYGIGNLGPRSIQGCVREFSSAYSGEPDAESVVKELYEFFSKAYQDEFGDTPGAPLGFFVAGVTSGQPFPEEWEFLLPRDREARQVRPPDQFGASWRGTDLPFTRLYKGFDPRTVEALKKLGVAEAVIDKAVKGFESTVVYDGMPLQDAINFVVFILQTTLRLAAFELGPASCGGPLQVATILPETGFEWVQEPTLAVRFAY